MARKNPPQFALRRGGNDLNVAVQIISRPTDQGKTVAYYVPGGVQMVRLEPRPYTPSLSAWLVPLPKSHRPIKGSPPRHRQDGLVHQSHRNVLPRGFWTLADGTEVLFDLNYTPMWRRAPDSIVSEADPRQFFDWKLCSFLHDFNEPAKNKGTLKLLLAILDAWGVVL
jgi:hypothetical protein